MKLLLVAAMLLVCVTAQPGNEFRNLFSEWKKFYNKEYNDLMEEEARLNTWIENWKIITSHNMKYDNNERSYRMALNKFADMNNTEFVQTMNGYRNDMRKSRKPGIPYLNLLSIVNGSLPKSVDWREHNLVTPVKNQGQCGSCWAFSTTGSLEGQHSRRTGKLVSLSEQNLVDCSRPEGNDGCQGGLMDQAFKYIKIQGGIDTEKSYPYVGKNGICQFKKSSIGAEDSGYVDVESGDEAQLQEASATVGPISVAIDAHTDAFRFYSSGVLDDTTCSSEFLDHGVLVVGYGTENGVDYWLVKNSWGEDWGDKGYIKMSRNKNNQCGIATQASYPLV